jgi:ATP phosphoribosyltransferase regulatory subunit
MRSRTREVERWRQVPPGLRDVVPQEAARRSLVIGRLQEEFRRWGYLEVATATLEYLDTFVHGAGPGIQDQLFKIVDSGGELLALRPDMTLPIARMAATRLLPGSATPLRLAYVAPVFRGQEGGPGKLREFTQAGVELLGDDSLDGDAEVIALAAECLRRVRVQDAVVNVGHLGFLDDLLGGLAPEQVEEIRDRLYRKEFVGIGEALADRTLARLLRTLPTLHGPEAIRSAREFARGPRAEAALDDLEVLMARLREYGVGDLVGIDLSIIRDFSYYTGIVFEAYGSGTGYAVLGGGRYDGLLARFGVACAATGFALGVDRVLAAVPSEVPAPPDLLLAADEPGRAQAVALAQELRRLGRRVIIRLGADWSHAVRQAEMEGMPSVARVEGERVRFYERPTGREQVMGPRELIAELTSDRRERAGIWSH